MIARSAVLLIFVAGMAGVPAARAHGQAATGASRATLDDRVRDFEKDLRDQAETDAHWRSASAGYMQMQKITYRSRAGDLEIPAFVFQPLQLRGPKGHAAL